MTDQSNADDFTFPVPKPPKEAAVSQKLVGIMVRSGCVDSLLESIDFMPLSDFALAESAHQQSHSCGLL